MSRAHIVLCSGDYFKQTHENYVTALFVLCLQPYFCQGCHNFVTGYIFVLSPGPYIMQRCHKFVSCRDCVVFWVLVEVGMPLFCPRLCLCYISGLI